MKILSTIRDWIARRRECRSSILEEDGRREFIYLDEVPVHSLLASRERGIATQYTDTQTYSQADQISSSASIGLSSTKAGLDSRTQSSESYGSQVLRKATIQTNFKELYDIEGERLVLRPRSDVCRLEVKEVADFERLEEQSAGDRWIIGPDRLRRGELVEVEVELEAEPIYQVAEVITTFRQLIEGKEQLFGEAISDQTSAMQGIAQVLEGLLIGLIPVRGRLIDYRAASIGDSDLLVHQSLLARTSSEMQVKTYPVYLASVTQRDLYWKDVRRVLFTKARYTAFCRIETNGLGATWNPVKAANVLSGIAPDFEALIKKFSMDSHAAMATGIDTGQRQQRQVADRGVELLEAYVSLLAEHHRKDLTNTDAESLVSFDDKSREEDWLDTIEGRRKVLRGVTERFDDELGTETSRELASKLRQAALCRVGIKKSSESASPDGSHWDGIVQEERFLSAETIAIYW